MKKSTKLLSLLFAAFMIAGCSGTRSDTEPDDSDEIVESHEHHDHSDETSDSSGTADHTHTWDTNWSSDETYHWHKCTGTIGGNAGWGGWGGTPCTEVKDKAPHSFDEGKITTPASAYADGVKTYTCSVCNYKKTERIPASGGGSETQGQFTFNDTQLNTPQEIHTSNQLKYLNFTGDYYNITASDLTGFGASGKQNVSTPNAITLSWDYTVPSGKTVSSYQVVMSQTEDLSNPYVVNAGTNKSITYYNSFLGDNYFKVLANLSDNSVEVSAVKCFKVVTQAPRNLKVGNLPNCRDTGGRTTVAGGTIKQGLIYRTSGNKFDNSSDVNAEAKTLLANQLKVKTEINVADDTKYNINASGTTVKTAFMDYGKTPYSNMSRNSQRIRQVFEILSNEDNYPVYYHCRIGTDRTGIVGICLGGLLGIPFNEVMQDYGFSNFAPIDGQRYPHKFAAAETSSASQDGNGDDPAKYIDEILAMPGKNFQEQTYYSLLSLGIPSTTLDKVINIMTEGTKATITPYKLALAGQMTLAGGASKKTGGSDYKDPTEYVEISSGKSVSFTSTLTAGDKDVVVFLGSTNSSDSKKLADGIELKIDGTAQTIINRNYWRCGFGTTSRTGCTGYMFINLGKYNLSAGEHTITITGKSSDVFKVGSLGVFDHAEQGQGGGQGGQGGEHTTHTWTDGTSANNSDGKAVISMSCTCGKVGAKIAIGDYSSKEAGTSESISNGNYKFGKNGSATYKITVSKAGTYQLFMTAKAGSGSDSQTLTSRGISFVVNNTAVEAYMPGRTTTGAEPDGLGMTIGTAKEILMAEVTLRADQENIIQYKQGTEYRLEYSGFVKVLEK